MRILVVDDEPLVRKGIISMLETDIEDAEIIGEAGTGEAAIKIIEELKPDVVLTDIIMPTMNGIELLKWIMLNFPSIKSVVLSCHQEFQYVKDAFLYGAVDYVLKYDIDKEVMLKMIETLKNALSENQKVIEPDSNILFENDLEMLKSSFLRGIINGRIVDEAEILNTAKKYKLSINLIEPSYLLNVEIDDNDKIGDDNKEQYIKELSNIIKSSFKDKYNYEPLYEGKYSFIIIVQPIDDDYTIKDGCVLLQKNTNKTLNSSISVGISNRGNNFKHFAGMLSDAKTALGQKFFRGKSSIVFKENIKKRDTGKEELVKKNKNHIIDSIMELSLSDALLKLKKLFELLLDETACNVLQSKLIYISMEEALINATKNQIGDAKPSNRQILESEFLSDINHSLEDKLIKTANHIINIIDSRKCSEAISNVIAFINSHYSDIDISLEMVANEYGYTPAYLSRLFKQETSKNLVDYVNEVRIFEAKKLLKMNDKKVYEIAEHVGYNNYNYFSKVFKKYVGVSPSEYSGTKQI